MALLQPQHQQQHSWFFIDLEEDGGICEVEVDVVGSGSGHEQQLDLRVIANPAQGSVLKSVYYCFLHHICLVGLKLRMPWSQSVTVQDMSVVVFMCSHVT